MTIKVFLSPTCTEPFESHEWEGTILGFLDSFPEAGLSYSLAEIPRAFIVANGLPLSIHEWSTRELKKTDDVTITAIPLGSVFQGLGSILGGIVGLVFGFLMPSNKGVQTRGQLEQGRKLDSAEGKANIAKLNDVVPEHAGTYLNYVNYLNAPRRYFENRRDQMLEFLTCVGPGYYEINPYDVKIADTPFMEMGDDAWFQVFEPDSDLSSLTMHENWYTSPEVGGTSSGTAGLLLPADADTGVNTNPANGYLFNGLSITRSTGSWPSGWGVGTSVRIDYPRQYQSQWQQIGSGDDAQYYRNIYIGYFGHVDVSQLSMTHNNRTYYGMIVAPNTLAYYSTENNRWYDGGSQTDTTFTASYGNDETWQIASIENQTITLSPISNLVFESSTQVSGARVIYVSGVFGQWSFPE